jgi:hypothetical protein
VGDAKSGCLCTTSHLRAGFSFEFWVRNRRERTLFRAGLFLSLLLDAGLCRFERALSPRRSLGAHKWNLIDHRCFMSNFTKCWNTSIGAQRPLSPEPFVHRMAFTLNKTGPAVVRPFSRGSIMRYTTSCCKSRPATIFDCWILLHPRCGCSIGQAFRTRRRAALLAFPRGPHASFSTTSPSTSEQLSHGPSETHQEGESF